MSRLSALVALWLVGLASAATPPSIERIRIGLPTGQGGQEAGCSRDNAWTAVVVSLRGGKEGNPQGEYLLRLETIDLADNAFQTTAKVPAIAADSLQSVMVYVVPGRDDVRFRLEMLDSKGSVVATVPAFARDPNRDLLVGQEDVLYLGVGGGLSGMKRIEKADRPDDNVAEPDQIRRQYAFVADVQALPDRWIGYDGVDVVILGTGNRDFVLQLSQESEAARRNALLDWVQRGGQLVLSGGRNHQELSRLLTRWPLLNVQVTGSETMASMPIVSNQWSGRINLTPLQKVEVATLQVGPKLNVLVREARKPVIVQSACGLGRVILVAFDLDSPPFSTWNGQESFWQRLQREITPVLVTRPRGKAAEPAAGPDRGFNVSEKWDYREQLKRGLETFEESPTISFGWVALFLLGYVLLVGPLDYFILKKVFKRLELTWITFPLTVLLVSIAAYVTAYALKGDDLRINKIDLVDVDLNEPMQARGTTWFTLFSPRVADYTIGITPAESWTGELATNASHPVMTLLETGDRSFRVGSQELFRRPYEFADQESGLLRVPIPVWATQSFSANWRASLKPKSPPIGFSDDVGPLRLARDGKALVGRLTNELPIKLLGVTLIHRERCYSLGAMEPGESKRIEPLFAADAQGQGRELTEWLTDASLAGGLPLAPSGRPINANFLEGRDSSQTIKSMLFYRANERANSTNAGLRRLDESWRVKSYPEYPIPDRPRYRDEVVLVAHTPMLADLSEVVTEHPASPSRLWVGSLPDEQQQRPALKGTMTQETYLRVFIPVQVQ